MPGLCYYNTTCRITTLAALGDIMAELDLSWDKLILKHGAHRLAVVDDQIRAADSEGFWHPVTLSAGDNGAIVLMELGLDCLREENAGHAEPYERLPAFQYSAVPHVAHRLHRLRFDRHFAQRKGVKLLTDDDFNNPAYIPIRRDPVRELDSHIQLQVIDMRGDERSDWQPAQRYGESEIRPLLLTRRGPGMAFEPERMKRGEPPVVTDLKAHYGTDILRRIAYNFAFAPSKRIDTYISALPDSGKDALLEWLRRACGGEMTYRPLAEYVKPGRDRFTVLERDLCNHRLVFANEADKDESEKPLTLKSGFLTRITSAWLTDEEKGEKPVLRRRRGDLAFMGNAAPNVELAPGVDSRMRWAYEADWPVMPSELYVEAMHSQEASEWLSTYLLEWALLFYTGKADPDWRDGERIAADMRENLEAPETVALVDAGVCAGAQTDYLTAGDIRVILAEAGLEKSDSSRLLRYLTPINARTTRRRIRVNGTREHVFYGLRWSS